MNVFRQDEQTKMKNMLMEFQADKGEVEVHRQNVMNQEQRQLAAARDLTRHWESSPMDPPSRVEWFKFFRSENTAFKSTDTRPTQW